MMRRHLGTKIGAAALIAFTLVGGWLVAPGIAHDSGVISHNWSKHYKPLATRIFYSKTQSNARFINVGERASNSALLDGLDSAAFAAASHVHSGADITTGTVADARIDAMLARDAEVFGLVTAADGADSGLDADLFDGLDSGDFALAGRIEAVQWSKESADSLGTTATSERVVFTAPEHVTITNIFVEPAQAVTANDTNYATITVYGRGANGAGQVTVASATTQTSGLGGTGSWAAFDSVSLGALSNTVVTTGKKLTIEVTKTGVGVTLPVLAVQIEYAVA